MKVTKKMIRRIIADKPETFKGTQHQWRNLVKEIIRPPSSDFMPIQDKETGAWSYIKL